MPDAWMDEVFGPNLTLFARARDVAEELGHDGIRSVHLAIVVLDPLTDVFTADRLRGVLVDFAPRA
jgi:hypothetical protein